MPIYEYTCSKCGYYTEVLQKFSDPPVTRCEHCKGKMRKLISQSSFHLKGTGWYVTDYANKLRGDHEKAAKPDEKTPSEKSKASGEGSSKKDSSSSSKKKE
jgi:putative FmdB family regulatory protein